jgi:Cytochrome c554 and c-prime
MHRSLLALCALLFAPAAFASDLVGPEACRTCHQEAYKIWSQGPHARAADALVGPQRQQPLCLQCHSRDEVRSGAAAVAGVSCETCHGGGRFYQAGIVMRDRELARLFGLADLGGPGAGATCLACHGGEQQLLSGPFDLKAALAKIDHWTADRAARKAQSSLDPASAPRTLLAGWLRSVPGDQASAGGRGAAQGPRASGR